MQLLTQEVLWSVCLILRQISSCLICTDDGSCLVGEGGGLCKAFMMVIVRQDENKVCLIMTFILFWFYFSGTCHLNHIHTYRVSTQWTCSIISKNTFMVHFPAWQSDKWTFTKQLGPVFCLVQTWLEFFLLKQTTKFLQLKNKKNSGTSTIL